MPWNDAGFFKVFHSLLSLLKPYSGFQKDKNGINSDSEPYFPKALNMVCLAGLLTCPGLMKPSHPEYSEQWQVIIKPSSLERSGITAAGTVADSHRIPFSLPRFYFGGTPIRHKDKLI